MCCMFVSSVVLPGGSHRQWGLEGKKKFIWKQDKEKNRQAEAKATISGEDP